MADSVIEESDYIPGKDELDWGYEEGAEWGLLFPEANGDNQSPINLNSREARYDPGLLDVGLTPNYVVCRDCEVVNDGHTVRIMLKSKSVVTGGPLPSDHEYELHEVRFHWGKENQRGSEHTVNFKAFPMELHLIHWNSTLFNSVEDAMGKKNGILIIALFVQVGKEHLGLKAVTEVLQDLQYKVTHIQHMIQQYTVIFIFVLQIEEFRRLRSHVKGAELLEGNDGMLGDNFRPTQPLSDRVVRAAFQ
uniref:Carbonic anhydrase n=1 Tax=Astyanax mexicanus TaxID=7994 RepID=A0A8B9K800_ASTMX